MKVKQVSQAYKKLLENELFRKQAVVWLGFFGVIVVLKFFLRGFFLIFNLSLVLLLLGGAFGMMVSWVDRLIWVYYTRPKDSLSVKVKGLIKDKKVWEAFETLKSRGHEQDKLAMSNVLFLAVWCVLSFFVMSSSPSWFGKGVIMGIGLSLVYGIWEDWDDQEKLMGRLFWPIKRRVKQNEMQIVLAVFLGFFAMGAFLAI